MSDETPKQLKLTPRGEKKEKEEKGNKWVIFLILVVTVIVSLVFYLSGGRRESIAPGATSPSEKGGDLFGPKVYQF